MSAGNITQAFKNQFISQFINDVKSANSNYFITFGRNYAWPDDMNPPPANTSVTASVYQFYTDMLFGKKISGTDIAYMVRRVDWTANTVYAQYDDTDPDLFTKDFYVMNSSNRVYKCLSNNYGARSTIEPQLFNVNGDFNTADGYKWKYMFRVTSSDASKFMTPDLLPVEDDISVQSSAEPGAIHTIILTTTGNNYISANGTIEQVIDPFTFKIANSSGSVIPGAHNLSSFYIEDAAGNFNDENGIVANYSVNSAGKFVITQNPVNVVTSGTLYYKIAPQVQIIGDGFECFAVAQVNALTTSIHTIEVIDRGYDYTYATVNIIANTNFGSGATARAIISPPGGHGSNAIDQMGTDVIGISLSTDTSDNLPDWISYRQTGLLYNPISSSNGTLFQDTTFTQMLELDIFNVFDIYPEGEVVVGQSSGATGVVIYQTTTKLYLGFTTGVFTPFETIVGNLTGFACSIDTINNRDLIPNSGDLYYYRNFEPISRIGLASEQVKIYFKI